MSLARVSHGNLGQRSILMNINARVWFCERHLSPQVTQTIPVLSTLTRWFDAASADLMRGHCKEIGCRSLPTTPYHQHKPTECRDCSFEISQRPP